MLETFYDFFGLNEIIFAKLNYITNNGIFPYILQAISSIFFIANFAIFYALICLYFYFKTRNAINTEEHFTPIYDKLVLIGICYTIFGFTFAALKFSVNMPRPFCSLDPSQFATIANIEFERCLSSFPSAHTGLSILVTYALWQHINNIAKIIFCIIIVTVAVSRVTLAMHYPADIIYSSLVTLLVIITGNIVYKILKPLVIIPIKRIIIKLVFKQINNNS